MQQTRNCYQVGSVALVPRTQGPDVWVYRWRERDPQGKTVRKSEVVGTIETLRTKAQAMKAAEGIRLQVNSSTARNRPATFGALIDRFIRESDLTAWKDRDRTSSENRELPVDLGKVGLEFSTCSSYLSNLERHIRPEWGECLIEDVRPALVQEWLHRLDLSPKTKGHIKSVMHRLFEKAMLWELTPLTRNPMQLVEVRGISKRTRRLLVLTAEQCVEVIKRLPVPYGLMVTVAACTGLRASEVLALQWPVFDFERLMMLVRVKVVNGWVGRVKTDYSEDELPLDRKFAALLKQWKKRCEFTPAGWVFPSHITGRPYHSSPIQQDFIRPAGEKLGLRGLGWHTFRHTYRSWLDAVGAPIGVQQKLMRHASPSTTLSYGNALMSSKRETTRKLARMALDSMVAVAAAQ